VAAPARRVVIHLVHGTWGRGLAAAVLPWYAPRLTNAWFRPESEFCRSLGADGYAFRPFEWSGMNSIIARARAAQRLRGVLQAARREDPEACQIVIAHSHGGNVVVQALQHEVELPDGIATLGTPFLHARMRAATESEAHAIDAAYFAALLSMFLFISGLFIPEMHVGSALTPNLPGRGMRLTVWTLAALVVGFGIVMLMPFRQFLIARARSEHGPIRNLLVLRAPRDEASAVLAASQLADALVDLAWRVIGVPIRRLIRDFGRLAGRSFIAYLLALVGLAFATVLAVMVIPLALASPQSVSQSFLDAWNGRYAESQFTVLVGRALFTPLVVLGSAMFALLFVVAVLSLAGGVSLLPLGWELLFCGLNLEVTAEATPAGGPYHVETIVPTADEIDRADFRHSLYRLPSVQRELARWIESTRRGDASPRVALVAEDDAD
jgi:hypothetical protein